ncbi:MAG: hypothetical protein FWE95_11715 [Planctomycetaceae bacterium]|nr:hypothetical protein [Planctomycetaceae bacterium]
MQRCQEGQSVASLRSRLSYTPLRDYCVSFANRLNILNCGWSALRHHSNKRDSVLVKTIPERVSYLSPGQGVLAAALGNDTTTIIAAPQGARE